MFPVSVKATLSAEAEKLLAEIQANADHKWMDDLLEPSAAVRELVESGKIRKAGAMMADNWSTGRGSSLAIYRLAE
jgi:hypothetical protein